MNIDDFWKRLAGYGVEVPAEVQRRVGLDMNQERVLIRPPAAHSAKTAVVSLGTTVPATFVARKLGVSVRTVQRYRKLLS